MSQLLTTEVIACAIAALLCFVAADRVKDDKPEAITIGLYVLGAAFVSAAIGFFYGFRIKPRELSGLKATIALGAAALSIWEVGRIAQKKPVRQRYVKAMAFAIATMSVAAYMRFGDIGYRKFYHRWEHFHYFMGSKYNRELGYKGLYECTAIAQVDLGMRNEVAARKLRNLEIDVLESTEAVLANPEKCKSRFTPERWEAFKADVKFFRTASGLKYWNDMQKDHGYNPPPVWTVAGHLLSSLQPASERFQQLLAAIDPLLFLGLFAAVFWAFGWRVFCVALTFWGCQLPAEYFWTGGAFLRQDWLFFLVLCACLLKKRYFMLAGAAFAYSTLLRVFPGPLLFGPIVVAGWYLWKHRRFKKEHLRVAYGGILATALLVPISMGIAGKDSYKEFWSHIQVHNSTPLTNHMGLKTIVSHGLDGRMQYTRDEKLMDPFINWKQARRDRFQELKPAYYAIIAAIAVGLAFVLRRVKSLWIALCLSVVMVAALVEATCYYYSFFILAALLSRLRREFEYVALLVAGTSQLLVNIPLISYFYDDRYTVQSVLFFAYAVGIIVALWPRARAALESRAARKEETAAAA